MPSSQTKKVTITTIVFIAWAVSSVRLFGASVPTQNTSQHANTEQSNIALQKLDSGEDAGWTCPMHPDVHGHESERCPQCKMKLVKDAE